MPERIRYISTVTLVASLGNGIYSCVSLPLKYRIRRKQFEYLNPISNIKASQSCPVISTRYLISISHHTAAAATDLPRRPPTMDETPHYLTNEHLQSSTHGHIISMLHTRSTPEALRPTSYRASTSVQCRSTPI